MMKLRLFFAATFATFDSVGKLMVYDADLEEIGSRSFPTSIDQLYLVIKFSVEENEFDEPHGLFLHTFGERIEGQKNEPMMFIPYRGSSTAEPPVGYAFYVRIANPVFPKPGVYGFEVLVDNQSLGKLELRLVQEREINQ